jgi:hypothetical protein
LPLRATHTLNEEANVKNHGKMTGLVIATPFYEVKAYSPYVSSLVNSINVLHELKMPFDYYELSGDSYVDRAKNALVHRFLKSEFSHIMMIDSDEAWDVEGFCRVIRAAMAGAEVVGAAYPCKNNWEFYGCIPKRADDGSLMGKEIGDIRLLDMFCVPGGFIVYSRDSFERTRPRLNKYIEPTNGEEILEAFRCNIEDGGKRIGEDIYFQQRYKEAGGIVWLEPNVTIQHYGVKPWVGNYHNYLLRLKAENEVEKSIGRDIDETEQLLKEFDKV